MLQQNIKISQKRLTNNKLYTIINIGGLLLSFTILILLYVNKEFNVDKHLTNLAQLYSLNYKVTNNALTSAHFDKKIINYNEDFIGSSFLDMFSAKIIKKNKNVFFRIGKSILISESTEKKNYNEDPLNQTIKFDNKSEYIIEVELEDYPTISCSIYDYISSSPSTFFIPIFNNKL